MRLQFLKLHLGTLFLDTYRLPNVSEVLEVTGGIVKPFSLKHFYHSSHQFRNADSAFVVLSKRIAKRFGDLIIFSANSFLRNHNDHLEEYDATVRPTNLQNSALTFFEKFFDKDFMPKNNEELKLLLEWCLFVVQFKEGSKERTVAAVNLLEKVLFSKYEISMKALNFNDNINDDDDDDDNDDDDAVAEEMQVDEDEGCDVTYDSVHTSLAKLYDAAGEKRCNCCLVDCDNFSNSLVLDDDFC